jgi:hypothetical protein
MRKAFGQNDCSTNFSTWSGLATVTAELVHYTLPQQLLNFGLAIDQVRKNCGILHAMR